MNVVIVCAIVGRACRQTFSPGYMSHMGTRLDAFRRHPEHFKCPGRRIRLVIQYKQNVLIQY